MRKYLWGFQLALSNEIIYRWNFFFGRLREILVYIALVFVYTAIPQGVGLYTQQQLLSYLLISAFVSSLTFVYGMYAIGDEIVEGELTNYLVRPINYLGFWASRMLASRFLLLIGGALSVFILLALFPSLALPHPPSLFAIGAFIALLVQSLIMIQLIDFIGGSFSFWTYRSHGVRWFITVIIQFFCGAYLPIKAFPHWVATILSATPFPSLVGLPAEAYLGLINRDQFFAIFLTNIGWIIILGAILHILWQRGIKTYGAYGR